jgi:hypothetical protein
MTVRRYDVGEYRKPTKLPNGWLRVDAFLTRTGVFEYAEPDGRIRRELRLAEEVFHPDALASFQLLPVTDLHPEEPLTADNADKYAVGAVGENILAEGSFVRSSMLLHKRDAIRKVESGERREVSCGYTCDLEEKPGVHEGLSYDCIQRNIRGNHVALVPRGRAGPEVRVRMDAGDAVQVTASPTQTGPEGQEQPVKVRIDGVEYEGSEQLGQAVAKLHSQHVDALSKAEKDAETARAEAEKAKARADALAEDVKKLEAAKKDAENPERIRALIDKRVALETEARPHLDEADVKALPKLSEKDIKLAVLKKLAPEFKADGRSDEYVQARYEFELERADKSGHDDESDDAGLAAVRRAAEGASRSDAGEVDADKARQRMIEAGRNAWKPKAASAS